MNNKKLKILFIPADNLSANVSRAYYIARSLSKYTDLYFVTWYNHRSILWEGGKSSYLNTINCFLKSLFRKIKINKKQNGEEFYRVDAPVFIDALIGRILGAVFTKKIMRKHNKKTLTKLIKEIKPDVIFNADSFYFFPTIETKIVTVCDVQDDTDWDQFSKKLQRYEKKYKSNQFSKANLHYIVSNNAISGITKNIGEFPFKGVPNGADFEGMRKDFSAEIKTLKNKHNLHDKFIISYIGSDIWLDVDFTKNLFKKIYEIDKSIVLILVGNLPKIKLPNVINIGVVSANESYIYYNMSNAGALLKNSINSDFLYNAVPLKMVQYAAVKKPIITFPIKWSVNNSFQNTFHLNSNSLTEWVDQITLLKAFKWENSFDKEWLNYDWDTVVLKMYKEIEKKVNAPLNK